MSHEYKGLPLRRAITYAVLAGLWIIGSDWLLANLTGNDTSLNFLQTYKGWFFVIITALVFYLVLRHELRKLENEIKRRQATEEALIESQNRLIRAQYVAGMGDFTWDQETGEITWSQGIYDLLHYTPDEIVDFDLVTKNVMHPEDRERVIHWLQSCLDGDGTELPPLEYRVVRRDGEILYIRNQGVIERREGRKPRVFATVVDITDHIRREQDREKLQQQVIQSQKMESVGRLAGGVAHDFNNMLSVISGFTELSLAKVDKQSSLHEYLSEVLSACKRSTNITRQLLAFASKQTVEPIALDLNHSIEAMLKMLGRLIGEDITLIWQPGEDIGTVKIDPTQVDQILANLCVNARDAIGGVGRVIIETGTATIDDAYCATHKGVVAGEYVTLSVSDNGSGMDDDTQRHLFEPFFTTKEEGKGTGLGLATVFGIIKQNNGFLTVYSEPGEGSTFKIYLPQHPYPVEPGQSEQHQSADVHGSETILVVEDAQAVLKLTERVLSQMGYQVITAGGPTAAIETARQFDGTIHLLLTDVIMPDMNGQELGDLLQQGYPDMKILFMSGYTASVITDRGLLKEGVHFISKPFSKQDLSQKIRTVLDS
ncbi:hybrid sensor histidine kinase/response regulator [Desulfofustis glycolicus]|uniref:histidine kinase n=1 Tax=Desulfofustis glycolicus DSM 9705 TaxID=1121409 RepID=A0A1M5YKC2_9BACT|nr:ATP-binding protein [Desulfofustis glycolicus]MCB2214781.1 response regulator [Desulfobulbaceae bacterium]SHI12476.1 PAS domain S-box-containing protein [Desulfofustis glycolicus DSM 9705]